LFLSVKEKLLNVFCDAMGEFIPDNEVLFSTEPCKAKKKKSGDPLLQTYEHAAANAINELVAGLRIVVQEFKPYSTYKDKITDPFDINDDKTVQARNFFYQGKLEAIHDKLLYTSIKNVDCDHVQAHIALAQLHANEVYWTMGPLVDVVVTQQSVDAGCLACKNVPLGLGLLLDSFLENAADVFKVVREKKHERLAHIKLHGKADKIPWMDEKGNGYLKSTAKYMFRALFTVKRIIELLKTRGHEFVKKEFYKNFGVKVFVDNDLLNKLVAATDAVRKKKTDADETVVAPLRDLWITVLSEYKQTHDKTLFPEAMMDFTVRMIAFGFFHGVSGRHYGASC